MPANQVIKVSLSKYNEIQLAYKATGIDSFEGPFPDFTGTAETIISTLQANIKAPIILLRLLSSEDHPDKSKDELVGIIQKLGHDRYDPLRKGDRYENIENKQIDFFALLLDLNSPDAPVIVKHALQSFFHFPQRENQDPIWVDLGIVYDPDQIDMVPHQYEGREGEIKTDGFAFRNPNNKPAAVLMLLNLTE